MWKVRRLVPGLQQHRIIISAQALSEVTGLHTPPFPVTSEKSETPVSSMLDGQVVITRNLVNVLRSRVMLTGGAGGAHPGQGSNPHCLCPLAQGSAESRPVNSQLDNGSLSTELQNQDSQERIV